MIIEITTEEINALIAEAVPEVAPLIKKVGENPELGFEEYTACQLQCDYLQTHGFAVQQAVGGLPTAFDGSFSTASRPAPCVALLTEYDALQLPLGHACGHQLIMGAGLMAAFAVKQLMQKYHIPGTLKVCGCPGEELRGGKIFMLKEGVFDSVDAAILSHPFFCNGVTRNVLAVTHYNLEFFGRSSHASTAPEQGINALDGMTIFMNGINAWRQQLPTTSRVHGIITNGGTAPNAIPDYTSGFFYIRSSSNEYQRHMESRLDDIARGSALIAGCDYKLELRDTAYSAGTSNEVLAEEAERIMTENNIEYQKDIPQPLSTDFANVCDKLPGVNIYFDVTGGKQLSLHSHEFREVAASAEALPGVIRAAKVMTRLALNYLQDEVLRTHVKQSR